MEYIRMRISHTPPEDKGSELFMYQQNAFVPADQKRQNPIKEHAAPDNRPDLKDLFYPHIFHTERKTKMIALGDVFIAFPGGTGTLEEITEVMSKVSLRHLDAPCILYNLNGYYDGLKALLARMIEKGLSSPERQQGIYFVEDLEQIKEILQKSF